MQEQLYEAFNLYRAGNHAQAEPIFRSLVEASPEHLDATHLLGLTLRHLGRKPEAETYLRRALELRPGWVDASYNLGNLLSETRRFRQAIPFLKDATAGETPTGEALRALANAYLFTDRFDEAEPVFMRAVATLPNDPLSHAGLGQCLLGQGRFAEAVTAVRRALELAPDNLTIVRALALIHLAAGQSAEGEPLFRQLIATGDRSANDILALTLIGQGKDAEAEAVLKSRLHDPDSLADTDGKVLEALGDLLIQQRRHGDLATICNDFISRQQMLGMACTLLADVLLLEDRIDEAYRLLQRVDWGHGRFFAAKSLACFRQTQKAHGLPMPTRRAADPTRPTVTMEYLAKRGRFAQTVMEYMLVRLYADRFDINLETPEWTGNWFFDLSDPPITKRLPSVVHLRGPMNDLVTGKSDTPIVGIDVATPYALYDFKPEYRDKVRSWLRPREMWLPFLEPMMTNLRKRGRTVVAMHLRRGDFLQYDYPITNTQWCLDWLEANWAGLDDPVLFVASDDLDNVLKDFAKFHPVTAAELGEPWPGLEYLQDFHILMHADILAISRRSGFSFLAALLAPDGAIALKPDEATNRFVTFDPWNTPCP